MNGAADCPNADWLLDPIARVIQVPVLPENPFFLNLENRKDPVLIITEISLYLAGSNVINLYLAGSTVINRDKLTKIYRDQLFIRDQPG